MATSPWRLLLVGALLFLLINLALYPLVGQLDRLLDRDRTVWDEKADLLFERDRPLSADGLILGDSQVMSGIVARQLTAETGIEFYNLALPSMQPEAMELWLHTALHRRRHFKLLVVGVGPYTLLQTEVYQAYRAYYRDVMLRPGRGIDPFMLYPEVGPGAGDLVKALAGLLPLVAINARIGSQLYFSTLADHLPTSFALRQQQLPSGNVTRLLYRPGGSLLAWMEARRAESQRLRALVRDSSGSWIWNTSSTPSESDCPSGSPQRLGLPGGLQFQPRPGAVAAYRRLLQLAVASADRVILVEPPLSSAWWEVAGGAQMQLRLSRMIDSIELPAGVERLSTGQMGNGAQAGRFQDYTHLSFCGATNYTRILARQINQALPAGREPGAASN